jgi:acetyl esterase/lipase
MDVYSPLANGTALRPALIMAFGGAFHRGTREDDTVNEAGHRNTPVSEYCRRFAARGYVCFSIDYRLTQEDPHPGEDLILGDEDVPRSRIDFVRKVLGLDPSTADMIRRVQEAGIEDMATAFRFVRGHAESFGIAKDRIAVGGFSAGGRIALNAALGKDIEPAAVVGLSAFVPERVMDAFAVSARKRFPVFLCRGENDLHYVRSHTPVMCGRLAQMGVPCTAYTVPGGSHFYPAEAAVVSEAGETDVLEAAMARFLDMYCLQNDRQKQEA